MERLREALRIVGEGFRMDVGRWFRRTPFEMLVAVILSQRTSRENVAKALELFRKRFKRIEDVASASVEEIEKAIKPAGLYRMKAERIKAIAEALGDERGLEDILRLPYEEARRRLMEMPGVGPKTADVFLMAVRREPVLPIDTHIFRIMRRLGVIGGREDYEELRERLESIVPPEERMRIHLALIEFGRNICRPREPRCGSCPISRLCPSGRRRLS